MARTKTASRTGFFGWRRREPKDPNALLLRQVDIFRALTHRELKKLADIVHERQYKNGEAVFEQGHPGAAMFIVKSGALSIRVTDNGNTVEVARVGAGSFIGELALLDDSQRSASALCLEPTTTLAFFRSDLEKAVEIDPDIGTKVFKGLALLIGRRLKAMNAQVAELHRRPTQPPAFSTTSTSPARAVRAPSPNPQDNVAFPMEVTPPPFDVSPLLRAMINDGNDQPQRMDERKEGEGSRSVPPFERAS
jgi:CRP/FNR family transcriptional regulator, cyclic AMP receptor protein